MGFFDRFRRRSEEDPEAARRRALMTGGRQTDGTVIEHDEEDGREMVRFEYIVQGVEFESCEFLTTEQCQRPQDYAPGATVGVRYDPKNHGNAIVI